MFLGNRSRKNERKYPCVGRKNRHNNMQKIKKILLSVFSFTIFSSLGIITGLGIGKVVLQLENEGLFSSWKLLDSSQEFETILEATTQTIWAQSIDGYLYTWNSNCYLEISCDQWTEAKEIPQDIHDFWETPMEKSDSCPNRDYKYLGAPPGNLIECARSWLAGPEFGEIVYYALLDNGEIWTWHHSSSMIFNMIIVPLICGPFGLFIGIGAFIIFMVQRKKSNKAMVNSSEKL